ncbi:MAG: hypothetical protein IPN17_28965 [Deltaproteobacteria bacterium]|nr:hypothetical protein [Deltaproteobacteria bacterium]
MIEPKAPLRALSAGLLLTTLSLVGCSFPTSEFGLGGGASDVPDAQAQDVPPTTDVPALDAPPSDLGLDAPPSDLGLDAPETDVSDDAGAADVPGDAGAADVPDDAGGAADADDATGDSGDVPCPTGQVWCVDACVDTDTSAAHCGRCGNQCSAANAASACSAGACSFTCSPGYADCNGVASDGCEADLSSAATCGSCMTRCDATNGTASCAAGACSIACAAGYGNCDSNAANGCEASLQTDVAHCGSCAVACANTNGTPSCAAGACAIACAAGYGNCDGNAANGCEASTSADPANCGACGTRCASGQSCVRGACTTICPYTMCGAACVDLATSVTHCGACGRTCAAPNGTARCAAGVCGIATCNAGYADCSSTIAGCEVNTTNDVANCGRCGTRCAFPNAAASCSGGACLLGACNLGYANCDGVASNGCETDLRTSATNCGACSNRCSAPNGTPTCAAGACGLGACNAGYANCDGVAANGCEVNTTNDVNNCGACRTVCPAASVWFTGSVACVASACTPVCNPGYASCDGVVANGCETSINTNPSCGACGRTCTGSCSATGGACSSATTGGYNRVFYRIPPPVFIDACAAAGSQRFMPNLDDSSVRLPLPFGMRFWNTSVPANTQLNITSNGWLSLNGVASQSYFGLIPDPTAPNWTVAPYLTDLYTSATGVCVATIGIAPSRRFVVEWFDAVFLADRARHVTFEAILNEGGTIEFYYDTMAAPPTGQNIAVGIENQLGNAAVTVCTPGTACTIASGGRVGYAVQ